MEEKPYVRPNILRLVGITLDDYTPVEDDADSRLLDQSGLPEGPGDAADEAAYPCDKIPHRFTTLAEWPHSTNLRCWQCDFTFDDRPKFVATYVRESDKGGIEIGVLGNFCTFNCCELWIEVNLAGKPDQLWRAKNALCLVYFLFTGHRVSRILRAPPKTRMCQYGGEWSEDTFWERLRALDPLAGLRDHTPGSIVPERNRSSLLPERGRAPAVPEEQRPALALEILRACAGDYEPGPAPRAPRAPPPKPLGLPGSVWAVCGAPPPGPDRAPAPRESPARGALPAAPPASAPAAAPPARLSPPGRARRAARRGPRARRAGAGSPGSSETDSVSIDEFAGPRLVDPAAASEADADLGADLGVDSGADRETDSEDSDTGGPAPRLIMVGPPLKAADPGPRAAAGPHKGAGPPVIPLGGWPPAGQGGTSCDESLTDSEVRLTDDDLAAILGDDLFESF